MEECIQQFQSLKAVLHREVEAFHRFVDLERSLQQGIIVRNWKGVTPILKSLKASAKELLALEEEREATYRRLKDLLGVGEEGTFYDVCFHASGELREELFRLHRELKHAVVLIEGISCGIDVYCGSTLSTMGKFMETLLPGWKHKVYSPKGFHKESTQPLLVNQAL